MQIDIGFGDVVYPLPEESVIAEKFEAMIKLGSLNIVG